MSAYKRKKLMIKTNKSFQVMLLDFAYVAGYLSAQGGK